MSPLYNDRRLWKCADMGEGAAKDESEKEMLTYFMDGPFANSAAGPTLQIFQQK